MKTKSTPTIEVYRGHDLLVLNPENKWPTKFGLARAEIVLDHMADIEEFVQSQREKLKAGEQLTPVK